MKKKVFITCSLLPNGQELLESHGIEVDVYDSSEPINYQELLARSKYYDGLICTLNERIDEAFLTENSHLKIIANHAVGFNNIDTIAAARRNIAITNTPGVLTEATAEMALGLMIAAARNFKEAADYAADGLWKNWEPRGHLGQSLRGKTLGIVGLGRIGLRVAEMGSHAFKMKVIYTSNSIKENNLSAVKVNLETLLQTSDFLSLHVPLNEKTKKMLGKNEFSLMKKTAVLINTSRGEIIDQVALIEALKNNQIFAAGLDVTDPEPLSTTSELFSLKNVLVMPHIGSATFLARREMSLLCAENILAAFEGRSLISPV